MKQLIEADVIGPVNYVSAQIFVKMPEDEVALMALLTLACDPGDKFLSRPAGLAMLYSAVIITLTCSTLA